MVVVSWNIYRVMVMVFNATFKNISVIWSHGSWIYNYLCNQFLSPLMLWVRISIKARCTTLCDEVCHWLATGRWFSPVSFTNKTVRQYIVNDIVCRFRKRACAFEFPPLWKANCFVPIQLFVPFDWQSKVVTSVVLPPLMNKQTKANATQYICHAYSENNFNNILT
jgi:hypothetical protein